MEGVEPWRGVCDVTSATFVLFGLTKCTETVT